jgi:hypothetical protein
MVMINAETEASPTSERMGSFEEIHSYLWALLDGGEGHATDGEE